MSWEDEHIDNLFREAKSDQNIEFKEDYWTEFEKMLPEKTKKKGIYFWWMGLGVVAFMLILFTVNVFNGRTHKFNTAQNSVVTSNRNTKKTIKNLSATSYTNKLILNKNIHPINSTENGNSIGNSILNEKPSNLQKNLNETDFNQINTATISNQLKKSKDDIVSLNQEVYYLKNRNINYFTTSSILYSEVFKPKMKHWLPYFDVYYSFNQSPISSNELGSNLSHGYGVGVGMIYRIKPFIFSFGINVANQKFNNLLINDRAKVYGFGVTNFEQSINYKNIYTLEFPVYAGVQSNKHMFQIGFVTSYLMNTKLNYELKENGEITESGRYFNYKKGLNEFNIKPSLKYAFRLSPTFQIGAILQIQMNSSLKSVSLFTGKENSYPINGQIYIRKTLFK